jgi:hypothetical protein
MRFDKLAWFAGAAIAVAVGYLPAAHAQYAPQPQPPPPPGYGYPPPPPGYYPPPRPPGIERSGLALGVSLGGGSVGFNCDDCPPGVDESFSGPSLTGHIGVSLMPNAVLLLDLWGQFFQPNEFQDAVHNIVTISFRYFPLPKLWLQGGLGYSYFTISDEQGLVDQSESGGAILGAIGFDVFQGWSYSIDISLRLAASSYENGPSTTTGAFQLGFNWY